MGLDLRQLNFRYFNFICTKLRFFKFGAAILDQNWPFRWYFHQLKFDQNL